MQINFTLLNILIEIKFGRFGLFLLDMYRFDLDDMIACKLDKERSFQT